ncbi:MAG: isopentenyl phosphate kinase [Candidatus Helarchaeota archaeon]
MTELILLKIGGSIITKKDVNEPKIRTENLRRIAKEIHESYTGGTWNLVIIHGAGSFGHPIVKRTGIHEGITRPEQVFSFAETQLLQNRLNCAVCEALQEYNLPAIPIQPSASAILEKKRVSYLNSEIVKSLLDISLIPVLYGVPAFDKALKCSILSGDQIIVYLASKLHPDKIIFASNVDGILDQNNHLIEKITRDNYELIKNSFYTPTYDDVTGSMAGKIAELKNLHGINTYVVNGNKEGIIKNVLLGKTVRGTSIEF